MALASRAGGAYVCAANVHMAMEAHDSSTFADVVNGADLVVADGMPLVWAQRLFGVSAAHRVRGPDLTLAVAAAAARSGEVVAVYGGTEDVAGRFAAALVRHAPGLVIGTVVAPPFRPMTDEERNADLARLHASGASIVFVGLGCPKQERWMAEVVDRLDAVLLGVGAAFDFHAGAVAEAPRWLGSLGLEWLFRLASDPRRLWRRYARHNPRYVALLARQWLSHRLAAK